MILFSDLNVAPLKKIISDPNGSEDQNPDLTDCYVSEKVQLSIRNQFGNTAEVETK